MDNSADKVRTYYTKQELGEHYHLYRQMQSVVSKSGIQARMPFEVKIQ